MYLKLDKLIKKYKIESSEIAYIGANLGQNILEFNKLLGMPIIHLFEPQQKVFNKLKENFSNYSNLKFYNFALGAEAGKSLMNVNINNSNQSSSLLKPGAHTTFHKKVIFEGTEEINIEKFSNLNLSNVTLLNIDVQGFELEVLKGCEDSLEKIKYILCEVNRKEMYEDCALVSDIDKYLKRFNFIRIETAWCQKTIPWGDALYLKTSEISFLQISKAKILNYMQSLKGYFFIISIPKRLKKVFKLS